MKSLTKTAVFFIIALLLTVVAAGTYSYFFLKMKDRVEKTIEFNAKEDVLEGREQRINTAVSAMKNDAPRIEKLSQYFIRETEIVDFTEKIEALGKESGVEFSMQSLDRVDVPSGASVLNLRVKATGDFQNVVKFMALLENFTAKFDWKNVKLVRNDGAAPEFDENGKLKKIQTNTTPTWSADITLVAFNFIKE